MSFLACLMALGVRKGKRELCWLLMGLCVCDITGTRGTVTEYSVRTITLYIHTDEICVAAPF